MVLIRGRSCQQGTAGGHVPLETYRFVVQDMAFQVPGGFEEIHLDGNIYIMLIAGLVATLLYPTLNRYRPQDWPQTKCRNRLAQEKDNGHQHKLAALQEIYQNCKPAIALDLHLEHF